MVTVLFAPCGHVVNVNPDKGAPRCPQDGNTRVARVLKAPLPRIVGHGSGPLVESRSLDAVKVNLAPDGPIKAKPKTRDEAHA